MTSDEPKAVLNDDDDNVSVTQAYIPTTTEERQEIALAESRAVLLWRTAVFFFLLIATAAVSAAVFLYVRQQERAALRVFSDDSAAKILGAIGATLDESLGAIDSFAVAVVSYARTVRNVGGGGGSSLDNNNNNNATVSIVPQEGEWPFVTVPDYAVRGSKLRSLSKSFLFSQYHLVTHADREVWETYTATHNTWVNDGIEVQKTDPTFRGTIIEDWNTLGVINYWGQPSVEAPHYLVRWQSSPIVPLYDPYNWNALEHFLLKDALNEVLTTKQAVMSETYNIDDAELAEGLTSFVGPNEDTHNNPAVDFYYPIIDSHSQVLIDSTQEENKVVGAIALSFFWRDLFLDILPGNDAMVVVIENTCDQTLTYQIDGSEVTYIGVGDHHEEPALEGTDTHSTFFDLSKFAKTRTYTGARLSSAVCPHSLHLYPAKSTEEAFLTHHPLIFMFTAVAIFAFTSFVFVMYDFLVERRQRTVMKQAVQSTAIVSSMFPSVVRDRLYEDATKSSEKKSSTEDNAVQTFMTMMGSDSSPHCKKSAPIADLFPGTTVMFADIKGFTAWSSKRAPGDVFTLLETLYGAFDQIATRSGVFKVETIGDSYVAVAGLPEPRPDHAVAMARFANEIRQVTNELTKEMSVTMGVGTAELVMRIGLHSGPTTAGVLRGQRARFQLFGDTVNTAARMESNGIGNKIQASQATADELEKAGKGRWVTRRANKILAKGKGQMQTYWVEVVSSSFSNNSDSIPRSPSTGIAYSYRMD